MILIVDDSAMRRSIALRERFLASSVPCALCTPDALAEYRGAIVTVLFAKDEQSVSLAAVRAGKSLLVAVNVSGRHMFHPEATVWDKRPDDEFVSFAIGLAKERLGVDVRDVIAGKLRITPDAAHVGIRYLALSPTEHMILLHLALHPDRYCPETKVRRYALANADNRKKTSSVKVHICHINEKAIRATGEKLVDCMRANGYAVITAPPKEKRKHERRGFVPPFC